MEVKLCRTHRSTLKRRQPQSWGAAHHADAWGPQDTLVEPRAPPAVAVPPLSRRAAGAGPRGTDRTAPRKTSKKAYKSARPRSDIVAAAVGKTVLCSLPLEVSAVPWKMTLPCAPRRPTWPTGTRLVPGLPFPASRAARRSVAPCPVRRHCLSFCFRAAALSERAGAAERCGARDRGEQSWARSAQHGYKTEAVGLVRIHEGGLLFDEVSPSLASWCPALLTVGFWITSHFALSIFKWYHCRSLILLR